MLGTRGEQQGHLYELVTVCLESKMVRLLPCLIFLMKNQSLLYALNANQQFFSQAFQLKVPCFKAPKFFFLNFLQPFLLKRLTPSCHQVQGEWPPRCTVSSQLHPRSFCRKWVPWLKMLTSNQELSVNSNQKQYSTFLVSRVQLQKVTKRLCGGKNKRTKNHTNESMSPTMYKALQYLIETGGIVIF